MDRIEYEILEDGTISVKTPGISGQNHMSADQMLLDLARLAGGAMEKHKRTDAYSHRSQGHGQKHSH